jgi:hypothetical protein
LELPPRFSIENLSSLFKRDNPNRHIFNILTPPLEEEVDSIASAVEDGGVQGTYGILYFHYIELTLIRKLPFREIILLLFFSLIFATF